MLQQLNLHLQTSNIQVLTKNRRTIAGNTGNI